MPTTALCVSQSFMPLPVNDIVNHISCLNALKSSTSSVKLKRQLVYEPRGEIDLASEGSPLPPAQFYAAPEEPSTPPVVHQMEIQEETEDVPRDIRPPENLRPFFPPNPTELLWGSSYAADEDFQMPAIDPEGIAMDRDDPEFQLLDDSPFDVAHAHGHEKSNAPLVTRNALEAGAELAQYSLFGQIRSVQ